MLVSALRVGIIILWKTGWFCGATDYNKIRIKRKGNDCRNKRYQQKVQRLYESLSLRFVLEARSLPNRTLNLEFHLPNWHWVFWVLAVSVFGLRVNFSLSFTNYFKRWAHTSRGSVRTKKSLWYILNKPQIRLTLNSKCLSVLLLRITQLTNGHKAVDNYLLSGQQSNW